jgi:hypothetical protein
MAALGLNVIDTAIRAIMYSCSIEVNDDRRTARKLGTDRSRYMPIPGDARGNGNSGYPGRNAILRFHPD